MMLVLLNASDFCKFLMLCRLTFSMFRHERMVKRSFYVTILPMLSYMHHDELLTSVTTIDRDGWS